MSTMSSAMPARNSAGRLPQAITTVLKGWWMAYMNWRLEQMAISRLRTMSDRELKDMGVSRSQITFAVKGEAASNLMFGRTY